VQSVIYSALNY